MLQQKMKSSNETILYVDLKKLERNYLYFKSLISPTTKIIGVVKAFAYGHGDIEVSKKLEQLGVYAIWVSDFEEGVKIRKAGIKSKIIVANPGTKSYDEILKQKLDVVIYNHQLLNLYVNNNNNINIHIKFNTGMNRYGFNKNEIKSVVKKVLENKHLNLLSICSHLAASDNVLKKGFTTYQLKNFKEIIYDFKKLYPKKFDSHILNSNGVLNYPEYQCEAIRIGIGLYGSTNSKKLKQISILQSIITQVREIRAGEGLGYGLSFIAKKNMKIAIVPVGYADGLNRRFSDNSGAVLINNLECQIIGKISMDSMLIDLRTIEAKEGDVVTIFDNKNNILEIAANLGTIPYEILATLNRRIKRVYSD